MFVFVAFAVLTLLTGISKGMPPIYIFEAAGWATAAWYWKRKNIVSLRANLFVLVLAILVAGVEGYTLGYTRRAGQPAQVVLPDYSAEGQGLANKMAPGIANAQSYLTAATTLCNYEPEGGHTNHSSQLAASVAEMQTAPFTGFQAATTQAEFAFLVYEMNRAQRACGAKADKNSDIRANVGANALKSKLALSELELSVYQAELALLQLKRVNDLEKVLPTRASDAELR